MVLFQICLCVCWGSFTKIDKIWCYETNWTHQQNQSTEIQTCKTILCSNFSLFKAIMVGFETKLSKISILYQSYHLNRLPTCTSPGFKLGFHLIIIRRHYMFYSIWKIHKVMDNTFPFTPFLVINQSSWIDVISHFSYSCYTKAASEYKAPKINFCQYCTIYVFTLRNRQLCGTYFEGSQHLIGPCIFHGTSLRTQCILLPTKTFERQFLSLLQGLPVLRFPREGLHIHNSRSVTWQTTGQSYVELYWILDR